MHNNLFSKINQISQENNDRNGIDKYFWIEIISICYYYVHFKHKNIFFFIYMGTSHNGNKSTSWKNNAASVRVPSTIKQPWITYLTGCTMSALSRVLTVLSMHRKSDAVRFLITVLSGFTSGWKNNLICHIPSGYITWGGGREKSHVWVVHFIASNLYTDRVIIQKTILFDKHVPVCFTKKRILRKTAYIIFYCLWLTIILLEQTHTFKIKTTLSGTFHTNLFGMRGYCSIINIIKSNIWTLTSIPLDSRLPEYQYTEPPGQTR